MIKSRFAVKQLTALALLAAVSSTSSFARNHPARVLGKSCHDTTLKLSIYNGGVIRTNDGYAFQIDNFDQFDTEFWLTDDNLSICAMKEMIKGRVVTVYTLKDSFYHGDDPGPKHVKLISGPNSK